MKEELLKEISDTDIFSVNNIYQFCIDNELDIGTVIGAINELIDEGKIINQYYCPWEERFSDLPIGGNSYIVLVKVWP